MATSPSEIIIATSTCVRCGETKPAGEFYSADRTCKECRKALVRASRLRRIDYYRLYDKERSSRPERRAASGMRAKQHRLLYPERWAAQTAVNNAVRDGRLEKPLQCQKCGCEHNRLHGHHPDYSRPLDVEWLCPSCHWRANHQAKASDLA